MLADAGAGVGSMDIEVGGALALARPTAESNEGRAWLQPWTWPEAERARGVLMLAGIAKVQHPLDADPVKIADKEVRTAIWGREGPRRVTYEDEYDHFPYFCFVISFIQLSMYVGYVGSEASWSGPPSGPGELWMKVYDADCQDLRHQLWRLWTYQWAHGHLAHVIGNCISNILFGGLLEAVHGTRNIGMLYTFGVITGGLTAGTFQPHFQVIGSSGGGYTMIGARITNLILNKDQMPKTFWIRVAYLALYLVYDTFSFFFTYSASSSYAAHAGGWLCGLLYGGYWLENLEEKPWELQFIKWCRRFFLIYILFCVIWYVTQPAGRPQGVFDSEGYCVYQK